MYSSYVAAYTWAYGTGADYCHGSWSTSPPKKMTMSVFVEEPLADEDEGVVAKILQSPSRNRHLPAPRPTTCPLPKLWRNRGVQGMKRKSGEIVMWTTMEHGLNSHVQATRRAGQSL